MINCSSRPDRINFTIDQNYTGLFKFILFILWPVGALLYSLKDINSRSSYIVFFCFCVLFGWCFTPISYSLDGFRYVEYFSTYQFMSDNEFYSAFRDYITFESRTKDYYFNTVSFYVSRFTNNYHFIFFIFAIVFSFFYLKSLKYMTANSNFRERTLYSLLLILLFTISNPIVNINGMRFWTASWVSIYCIFQIFSKQNRLYYILLLITPFIHGAYWIMVVLLLLAPMVQKYKRTLIILVYLSIPISYLSLLLIDSVFGFLPISLQHSVAIYTDSDLIAARLSNQGTGFSWVADIAKFLTSVFYDIFLLILILNIKAINNNKLARNVFSVVLVLTIFSNFTSGIPSVGGRFNVIRLPLLLFVWLSTESLYKYKKFIYFIPLIFSLDIFFLFYQKFANTVDFGFLYTNTISLILKNA